MRVAVLGRTSQLIDAARRLREAGHVLPVVWTSRPESFYGAGKDEFRALAAEAGAVFFDDPALGRADNLARLRELRCDVAISINWPTVLSRDVLESFPHGVLNAHAGDLPRYRGNACPNWAILNGESHIGLCIHQMAEDLDAGPVLVRDRMALAADTYIGDVYDHFGNLIPAMFAAAIQGLEAGTLVPEPQSTDPALSLRCYPRRPEDGRIDWREPVESTMRLIRASSRPFSGAFTTLEGERRVTVWRAEPFAHPGPFCAVPGQVCLRADSDPVVACGDGMVRLTDAEVEGVGEEGKAVILASLRARLV